MKKSRPTDRAIEKTIPRLQRHPRTPTGGNDRNRRAPHRRSIDHISAIGDVDIRKLTVLMGGALSGCLIAAGLLISFGHPDSIDKYWAALFDLIKFGATTTLGFLAGKGQNRRRRKI